MKYGLMKTIEVPFMVRKHWIPDLALGEDRTKSTNTKVKKNLQKIKWLERQIIFLIMFTYYLAA